jgi:hypothetical protein
MTTTTDSRVPQATHATDPALSDLPARINEAHVRAIEHAGQALGHAIACGKMLLEAKAKVPHGQWLPWLRDNITFGERSAQGYMRIANHIPIEKRNAVADLPIRQVLADLRTPLRSRREVIDAELTAWSAQSRATRKPVEDWTVEDAAACVQRIRAFDEIMHRHGMCPDVGNPEPCCLVCADEAANAEVQS